MWCLGSPARPTRLDRIALPVLPSPTRSGRLPAPASAPVRLVRRSLVRRCDAAVFCASRWRADRSYVPPCESRSPPSVRGAFCVSRTFLYIHTYIRYAHISFRSFCDSFPHAHTHNDHQQTDFCYRILDWDSVLCSFVRTTEPWINWIRIRIINPRIPWIRAFLDTV